MRNPNNSKAGPEPGPRHPSFPTTRWSIVMQLSDADAFAALCAQYRAPLLAYLRRVRSYSASNAEDVVQEFFVRLTHSRALGPSGPASGTFRSYLLGAFRHHLSSQQRHARALKRGGGTIAQTFHDGDSAADERSTDDAQLAYDRAWAVANLEQAVAHLEATYLKEGRGALFATLKRLVHGEETRQEQVACELGISEPALRVAVHRFRRRLGREVRRVIARTVPELSDIEREVQYLTQVLRQTHWSLEKSSR